jgi:DNA-binding NtrC family response regulator
VTVPLLLSTETINADARAEIKILVIDDESTIRESCASILEAEGYKVTVCSSGLAALEMVKRPRFHIIIVDLYMTQVDGTTLLKAALAANPDALVVVMTGQPGVQWSIDALRAGAWEYLPKPFSATQLHLIVGRAAHTVTLGKQDQRKLSNRSPPRRSKVEAPLGVSPPFRAVVELAQRVAMTDASVFITGDSGTGKEMIARFIHQSSRRADMPFVAINCAALPEQLLESEMFGHVKGAFTDAVRDKTGLLETANGGTLFFDELLEMSKPIQAKLLRVIQDGVLRRVGSESTDAIVNVRFLAATNRDPETAIREGVLREDLFYRLRVIPIHVPRLSERPDDIALLAKHFLAEFWARYRGASEPVPTLTGDAIAALESRSWGGNVRELQNVMEHTVVLLEPVSQIGPAELSLKEEIPRSAGAAASSESVELSTDSGYHASRERVIAQFEQRYLKRLIERARGNVSKAARIAGVDRTTLYRLMERHNLHRPNPGEEGS